MRVTRAIREYVEDEISKKYQAVRDTIGRAYYDECDALEGEIKVIAEEANRRAIEVIRARGFEPTKDWRHHDEGPISYSRCFNKPEESERINKECRALDDRKRAKIKQVLFDLEMGATEKAELIEVLDSITVD